MAAKGRMRGNLTMNVGRVRNGIGWLITGSSVWWMRADRSERTEVWELFFYTSAGGIVGILGGGGEMWAGGDVGGS